MKPLWQVVVPGIIAFGVIQSIEASSTCNAINAVTSASGRLQLKSGQACDNSAKIVWRDGYNNGSQHLLKYGLSTSYGSQLNLKPFSANADITTNIPGLSANTQYYGQFFRVYEGRTYTTNFSFKTAGGTSIRETGAIVAVARPALTVGSAAFTLDLPAGTPVTVVLHSLNGARVAMQSAAIGRSVDFAGAVPAGVYLCRVNTATKTFSRATVIGR